MNEHYTAAHEWVVMNTRADMIEASRLIREHWRPHRAAPKGAPMTDEHVGLPQVVGPAWDGYAQLLARAEAAEAEVTRLRSELDIAQRRGDGWRDKFNADTDDLARLRSERDEARDRLRRTVKAHERITAAFRAGVSVAPEAAFNEMADTRAFIARLDAQHTEGET